MQFVSRLKILILMTCLVFVGQGFADGEKCQAGTTWGGFTTEIATKGADDFYQIDTPEKLAWFACEVTKYGTGNEGKKVKINARLTQSIDLQGKLFIPISAGKGTPSFGGVFDGNGFAVKNLFIDASEIVKSENGGNTAYAQNVGFFATLNSATVTNLILDHITIYASSSAGDPGTQGTNNPISVGGLVGFIEASSTIDGVVVSGNIETSGNVNRVGGVAGNVWAATIKNTLSEVNILASGQDTHVGGVVGALRGSGSVTLSSCVYAGEELISTNGTVGAIAGNYEKASGVTTADLYYSADYPAVGANLGNKEFNSEQESDLNSEKVICALNGGEWTGGVCSGEKSDNWSVGMSEPSINGSDGFTISFSANGGSFASGAKTSKIIAAGATITADEIAVPTYEAKKFAGWAKVDDAEEPDSSSNLGEAHENTTLYAVWYDFYDVSFETNSITHQTEIIRVPKHGTVSVEGFAVPDFYTVPDPENEENTIKYYFTGWSYETKYLNADQDPTENDTLHLADIDVVADVALFPVWTKAKTFSVTFNTNLHGKTDVQFVKIITEGETVAEPNAIISDPGYVVEGWYTDEACSQNKKYNFETPLDTNLILYAKWDLVRYAINYNLDDGVNSVDNPTTYTVESDNIVFANPTKAGNEFIGWYYDSEFTNPATEIATGSTTGEKTLYAKWKPLVYTIHYASGGAVSATIVSSTKNWGESITLKGDEVAFQRQGYIHDGWSLIEGGPIVYNFGATYSKNEDLVLYPHWVEGNPDVVHNGAVTIYTYASGHVDAVINGAYEGADEVEITGEGITVNSVTLEREFNKNKISTLYVPFEIAANKVEGASVYKFKTVVKNEDDGRWKFKVTTTETVKPNTPYVVLPETTQVSFNITGTVTLNTTTTGEEASNGQWDFVGTYSYISFVLDKDNPVYLFANQECDGAKLGEFVKIAEGAFINPLRAYLVYHKSAALPKSAGGNLGSNILLPDELDIEVENENGIVVQTGKLNTVTGEVRMDRWFDLKGRRLNSRPSTKGTYYKNGKKVIIK